MNLVTLKFKGPLLFAFLIGGTDFTCNLYIYGSFNNVVNSFSYILLNVWLIVNKLLEKMKKWS
jgi:hypothetical protein